jgi:hypothetical protein
MSNGALSQPMPMDSENICNTQLLVFLGSLEKHDMGWGYGMVSSQILAQLLPWVLVRVPSDYEEVPFPSFVDIHY